MNGAVDFTEIIFGVQQELRADANWREARRLIMERFGPYACDRHPDLTVKQPCPGLVCPACGHHEVPS